MDNQELINSLAEMIENQTARLEDHVNQRIAAIELKIENDITRRIDALFDGYKLTHDTQWEQQREIDTLRDKVSYLEMQVQAIHKKLA